MVTNAKDIGFLLYAQIRVFVVKSYKKRAKNYTYNDNNNK